MMNDKFDKWPKAARIVCLIPFWGWVCSGLYRIFAFVKSKDVLTLVLGILSLVTVVVGFIVSIIDIVTVIKSGRIHVGCK